MAYVTVVETSSKAYNNPKRIHLILNFIFGHWFHVRPLRFRDMSYIFAYIFVAAVNVTTVGFSILSIYNMILSARDVKNAVFLAAGVSCMIQSMARSLFVLTKRKKVEVLLLKFEAMLIINQNSKLNNEVSRYTRFIAIFLMVVSSIMNTLGFVLIGVLYDRSKSITDAISNEDTIDFQEAFTTFDTYFHESSLYVYVLFMFFSCLVTFFILGKIIATDVLFSSWYMQIVEHYKLLVSSISNDLLQCNSGNAESITQWMQMQHEINRLLTKVNSITSPCIVLTMVGGTLQICFYAYLVAKNAVIAMHAGLLIMYSFLALFQMFMYCNFGQKIRNQVARLQDAAYSAPWQRSRREIQHATLMICSAATERAMPLPGAPFFALSLEFFASILGAVFTYFIVLLQLS